MYYIGVEEGSVYYIGVGEGYIGLILRSCLLEYITC